jgi:hypothetical protein
MGAAASARAPRREREILVVTTHSIFIYVRFDAGADDQLASLRAAVAAEAWPHRDDFELRVLDAGTDALHEAFDLHWMSSRPVASPEDAAALPDGAVVMAWTPQQWEGGACSGTSASAVACAGTAGATARDSCSPTAPSDTLHKQPSPLPALPNTPLPSQTTAGRAGAACEWPRLRAGRGGGFVPAAHGARAAVAGLTA